MVLLVNQHTVPIFTDIANAFAASGARTILFTGHIERGGAPLSSRVNVKKSIPYNRNSTVTRFFTWLTFSFHYFFFLFTCRKPDVILVSTNPPLAPIITAGIARLRRIPYMILIYDLYPEALFQAGLMHGNNWIFRKWQKINLSVFAQARKIFTLSESMKNAIARYVSEERKIKIVYNWADTNYIHPVSKTENDFVLTHGLSDKFIVLYSGNMGLTHDLESLIEAADLLRKTLDLKFVMIGDGGKRRMLEKMAAEKGLDNVLFLPYQNEVNFPLAMASADIGVVTLGYGAEGISVPSKTYINLAAGVCMLSIAPVDSELNRLIHEHDAGVICEPGNPGQIADSIIMLMQNTDLLNNYKRNALEAANMFTPRNAFEYVAETGILSPVTS